MRFGNRTSQFLGEHTLTKLTARRRLLASTIFAGAAMVGLPAAVTVVATLAPGAAAAQDLVQGTLEATVQDTSGAPIAGAPVTLTRV